MDDPSTLAAMMQVSHGMYKLAAPRLYSEVDIYGANLIKLVRVDKGSPAGNLDGTVSIDDDTPVADPANLVSTHEETSISEAEDTPRDPKIKLLSKVKRMAIHDIPSTYICNDLLARAKDPTHPEYLALETISIRPSAAWKLMQHNMSYKTDAPAHPFILYLEALKPQQLCIQLPILDQNLEDSLVAQRSRFPRNWDDVSYVRHHLRDAFRKSYDRGGVLKDLFGFSRVRCPNITIHNLTMLSTNRAFVGLSLSTKSVRIFYRPCSGADGEVTDKIWDHYCYNHRDEHNKGIVEGKFKLNDAILRSSCNAEFIDMDWVRDKYDPTRDDHLSRSLNRQVRRHLEPSWGTAEETKSCGKKRFKMSREVDACRCCGNHQLSAAEVSPPCYSRKICSLTFQSSFDIVNPKSLEEVDPFA